MPHQLEVPDHRDHVAAIDGQLPAEVRLAQCAVLAERDQHPEVVLAHGLGGQGLADQAVAGQGGLAQQPARQASQSRGCLRGFHAIQVKPSLVAPTICAITVRMTNEMLLRDITDREALTGLVRRLYELFDDRRFDELNSVYTDTVELDFPSGRMVGLEAVTAMARQRAERYDRMQHVSTDISVELDGDAARIRTNHLAFHVPDAERPTAHFDAGLVHRFDAVPRKRAGG